MFETRNFRLISAILCISIVASALLPSICFEVNADTTVSAEDSSSAVFRSVEESKFSATIKSVSQWYGHSNMEIKFTNTGNKTIHDWYFTFDFAYDIENPYNCNIIEHKDDLYTIGNCDWNQDILPGKTVTVGFTAASSVGNSIDNMPSFYLLNTKTVTLANTDLLYQYEEYSDWTSGYNGALILRNNSSGVIRDWTITLRPSRSITRTDSSVLKDNHDGTYTIANDGNNQNISKGQSFRLGIQGGAHDPSIPLEILDYAVTAKKLALGLDEDNDNNGIADVREVDYNGNVQIPTSMPTATPTPTLTVTPKPTVSPTPVVTDVPTPTPTVTKEPTPTVEPTITIQPSVTEIPEPTITPTVTVTPSVIDYETDTDGDLIPDDLETYYGTDKNNPDTDGDGLKDGYELFLELNPLKKDSDNNGINDGREDYDKDGLTNKEEQDLETNPMSDDTDYDKLTDAEEVKIYGTSPLQYDTDEDGISDYNEVRMGTNPKVQDGDSLRYQTLSYSVPDDSELKGVTSVTVRGSISGCIDENTKIKNVYETDTLSSRIKALVGVPVDIESTGNFGTMTIVFNYSDDVDEENLKVLWYDEDNNEYKVLRNSVQDTEANTVSVSTTHFSKYMLIDEAVWVRTWANACDSTNNYYNLFEWGYDMPRYIHSLENKEDSDGDGLPDCIEMGGMINNIGEVVRTDPYSFDTDGDTLSDGTEMGSLGFVIDAVPNIESSKYNEWIPVSYDIRWSGYVYYKQKSCPGNADSDNDGADDSDDGTLNEKNGPINYILYYNDIAITGLFGPKEEYEAYFKRNDMEYISISVAEYSDFEDFWMNVGRDYSVEDGYSQKSFSKVDNIIMILHGNPDDAAIVLDNEYCVWLNKMDALSQNIECEIENVDLQICHAGKYWDEIYGTEYHSFAELFAKNSHIHYVYGTPGAVGYAFMVQVNFVKGTEQFYRYSYVDGVLEQVPLGAYLFIMERMY